MADVAGMPNPAPGGPDPTDGPLPQANAGQLGPLSDHAAGVVPDETRLVHPLSVDQLRPLQDPDGAWRR